MREDRGPLPVIGEEMRGHRDDTTFLRSPRLPFKVSYSFSEPRSSPQAYANGDAALRRRVHSIDICSKGSENAFPSPRLDRSARMAENARLSIRRLAHQNYFVSSTPPNDQLSPSASSTVSSPSSSPTQVAHNPSPFERRRTRSEAGTKTVAFSDTYQDRISEYDKESETDEGDRKRCYRYSSADFSDSSYSSYTSDSFPPMARSVSSDYEVQSVDKMRNLQQLLQEGFITVTEFRDRRRQLVDERSVIDPTCPKTSEFAISDMPVIYRDPPDFSKLPERDAIKHVFDSEHRKWTYSRIKVKIDAQPFARGGLRQVFHLQDLSDDSQLRQSNSTGNAGITTTHYVAKVAIDPNEDPATYFRDVEMQAVASKFAREYNSYYPPRRVEFLEAWILQLMPEDSNRREDEHVTLRGTICGVEPFIAGEYHKHNNNFGYVSDLERNTPQAFSHFTYEASGHEILVVDIQGVGDHYTDPQIHTRRGKEFGKGNLAMRGVARFLESHRCNPICRYLKLPLNNPMDEMTGRPDPKGTVPAQRYMSQPSVRIDTVDSELCHYYGESNAFRRYHAQKDKNKWCMGDWHSMSSWCGLSSCCIS